MLKARAGDAGTGADEADTDEARSSNSKPMQKVTTRMIAAPLTDPTIT